MTDATLDVIAAYDLQRRLAAKVVCSDGFSQVTRVTGVEAAYTPDDRLVVAAAVTLDADTLGPLETAMAWAEVSFPYVRWSREIGQVAKVGSTERKDGPDDGQEEAIYG